MNTRKITGTAIFAALSIVFTLVSSYLPTIGGININLAILPIAIAAIMYGPFSGFIVGLVNGGFILLAPSTSFFYALSVGGTIVTCLCKSSIAGLLAGLLAKSLKKKPTLSSILSSLLVPIVNTGLFIVFSLIFFKSGFGELISLFVSINFIIELIVTVVIAPLIKNVIDRQRR